MTRTCSQYTFEDLNRFIDKDLPQDRMLAFQQHLSSCPACESQIKKLQAISSVFKANVSERVSQVDKSILKDHASQHAGFQEKTVFGNIFAALGKNIYLKLASITAILVISLFLLNENIMGPTGPSAIVSTVDTDMSSVMIIETQKEKHTIIWFTET